MLCDERIIVEMRICFIDPVYLVLLSRAQTFVYIEAPDTLQQSLTTEHFMKACNTAEVMICCIEERRIAIGDFDTQAQQIPCRLRTSRTLVIFHGAPGPY